MNKNTQTEFAANVALRSRTYAGESVMFDFWCQLQKLLVVHVKGFHATVVGVREFATAGWIEVCNEGKRENRDSSSVKFLQLTKQLS